MYQVALLVRIKSLLVESPNKLMTIFSIPFGSILYLIN